MSAYRQRASRTVEAMKWFDAGCCAHGQRCRAEAIVQWVHHNGGEARFSPDAPAPTIFVCTSGGWEPVRPGDYVVMGDDRFDIFEWLSASETEPYECRDFYPATSDSFEAQWEDDT